MSRRQQSPAGNIERGVQLLEWVGRWRSRRPIVKAPDLSGYDPWDPLLFTSPRAIEDCKAGRFARMDGAARSLEDLRWDLVTEVMRKSPWSEEELEFKAVLDRLLETGVIQETGRYWNNSPHGAVYGIMKTARIRILERNFKLKRGLQLVFQCRMFREAHGLVGPFMTGTFSPTEDSMLCGEMADAMMGMAPGAGPLDRGLPDVMGARGLSRSPGASRTSSTSAVLSLWQTGRPDFPEAGMLCASAIPADIRVNSDIRVAYFLIDVSGSMAGGRLEAARHALLDLFRLLPVNAQLRVGFRAFNGSVSALQGALDQGYRADTRLSLMRTASLLCADGSTAIFQAVWRALDDLQRLIQGNRTPAWYLVVLSDGEDNQGIQCRYDEVAGQEALFHRVTDLRRAGVLEYLPIAYGSGIKALDRLGGSGFHAEVTDPRGIAGKFAFIREHLMLGLPPELSAPGAAGCG